MNKKDLKMYEAPACEVVELEMSQILCASPTQGDGGIGGGTGFSDDDEE